MGLKEFDNEKRQQLLSKTPYVLPDNPSDKGLSAKQVKSKMYEGTMQLFDWMSENLSILKTDLYDSGLVDNADNLSESLSIISSMADEVEGKVPKDLSILSNEVVPKSLSILQQDNVYIYADNDGTPSKINLNNLDYTKIKTTSDLDEVRSSDYIFTEIEGE